MAMPPPRAKPWLRASATSSPQPNAKSRTRSEQHAAMRFAIIFSATYRRAPEGWYIGAPGSPPTAPLPTKFIDLKERLADMDAQGVQVHALSLTSPMVYWANGELGEKLSRAFNDGASAALRAGRGAPPRSWSRMRRGRK